MSGKSDYLETKQFLPIVTRIKYTCDGTEGICHTHSRFKIKLKIETLKQDRDDAVTKVTYQMMLKLWRGI